MNIWNKVFLGIVIVAAIAVLVLTGLEGSIRSKGQQHIAKLEKQIEETNNKIADIIGGADATKPSVDKSPSEWGLDELRARSIEQFRERGRAWFGCLVRSIDEITLPPALPQVEAQVIVTGPFTANETGAETDVVIPEILKGVVYVFEVFENTDESGTIRIEKSGKFLGRFNVSTVPTPTKFRDTDENEKKGYALTLISADPIDGQEIEQIMDSRQSRWAIYMTPPMDRVAGILEQLDDEQKLSMMTAQPLTELPEEEKQKLLEEFTQRYPPPSALELTEEQKTGVDAATLSMWEQYQQVMEGPASDFSVGLDWLYQRRSSLKRDIAITQADIETYATAEEKNQVENEKLEQDCVLEEKRVAAMNDQKEHVEKTYEKYDAEGNRMIVLIEKIQALQAAYAAKLAEYQLMMVEKIEGQKEE